MGSKIKKKLFHQVFTIVVSGILNLSLNFDWYHQSNNNCYCSSSTGVLSGDECL